MTLGERKRPNLRSKPMFISFDGIDGVGKSTQIRLFSEWLNDRGQPYVICRDPGSTPLGERIREILLHSDVNTPIGRRSEMLLYMAARAQLVDEVIQPALESGKVVVADRFLLANLVYQGHAGGLDVELIRRVGTIAIDGIQPDCTFLLDMSPEAAHRRLARSLDRMEKLGEDYRGRLRDGFLAEAARSDKTIRVINADRSVEVIQSEIRSIATEVFRL